MFSRASSASISVSRNVAGYLPAMFSARNEPTRVHSPALACFLVLQHSTRSCRHRPQRTTDRHQQQRERSGCEACANAQNGPRRVSRGGRVNTKMSLLLKKRKKTVACMVLFLFAFCAAAQFVRASTSLSRFAHPEPCPTHSTHTLYTCRMTHQLIHDIAHVRVCIYMYTCFGPVVLAIARRRTAPTG